MQMAMKVLCCAGSSTLSQQSHQSSKQTLSTMAIAKKKLPIMHNAATFELEFKKEAKFLKTFNHPHVVKMICAKVDDD